MSRGRVPPPLRILGKAAGFFFGGLFTMSIASTLAMRSLQTFLEAKRRMVVQLVKEKASMGANYAKGKPPSSGLLYMTLYLSTLVSAQLVKGTKSRGASIVWERAISDSSCDGRMVPIKLLLSLLGRT